jgi:hypothetical protein
LNGCEEVEAHLMIINANIIKAAATGIIIIGKAPACSAGINDA